MKILDWQLQAIGNLCVSTLDDVTAKVPLVNIRDVLENAATDAGIDELLSQAQQARELLCINTDKIEAVDAIRICLTSDSAATLAPLSWEMCLLYQRGDVLEWVPCGRTLFDLVTGSTLPRRSAHGLRIKTMHVWLQPVMRQGECLLQVYSEYEQLDEIIPPSINKTISEPVNAIDAVEDVCRCDWLHYAGHMNDQDFMTTDDARSSEHPFLGLVDTMPKAIFANGCLATRVLGNNYHPFERSLVYKLLYQKGVEVFLGPNDDVPDLYAGHFTVPFYTSLISGSTLGEAVRVARLAVLSKVPGLAGSYVFYGKPTLRPFTRETSPKRATMDRLGACFYCGDRIISLGTAEQVEVSGVLYGYCYRCNSSPVHERQQTLFTRSRLDELGDELSKISGGSIAPFEPSRQFADHGFLLKLQQTPPKFGWLGLGQKPQQSSKQWLIPVCAIPLDPFSRDIVDLSLDRTVRLARQDDLEPVIALAGARELVKPAIERINALGITVITLPDNRLFEPRGHTRIDWLKNFSQVPSITEMELVRKCLDRAQLLGDDEGPDAIALSTGLQPSLVSECLRLLPRETNP